MSWLVLGRPGASFSTALRALNAMGVCQYDRRISFGQPKCEPNHSNVLVGAKVRGEAATALRTCIKAGAHRLPEAVFSQTSTCRVGQHPVPLKTVLSK